MKEKIKEFSKKYLLGFTLGMLSAGIVSVAAAAVFPSNQTTYDNSNTGMQATEVQGAIDELYTTCFPPTAGEQIIEDNNLEKDPYECRYFFTGANPNNYITFNDEEAGWRILSIGCDNTIKIMKESSVASQNWDTSSSLESSNWNRPATLNTYLNGTYYNSLTSTAQSQIVEASYYAGGVTYNNNDMQDQINEEQSRVSNVKVALPTASEYLRTNSDNGHCGTLGSYFYNTCNHTTWMYYGYNWWLLTPNGVDSSSSVLSIYANGAIGARYANNYKYNVRPVVTISSSIQITGGNGSQSNPYTIE